ncbi:SDR family oxidoreductase [Roseivirga sp. BDSF3-8]|uniref:SDR family oxidoreductase n=1 Tax=Roseivirga sp. BDSF3-8 TaxID=3241598 RepID=UPI0035322C91
MKYIDNRIAVVTGASSGIGKAIARKFVKSGIKVVLGARSADELAELKQELKDEEGEVVYRTCDMTNQEQVVGLIRAAEETFGGLHILVNNAGVMPLSYLKNRHLEEWEQMVDVNIKGVLKATYAALPYLKEQNSSHIINIASADGRTIYPGGAVYAATKAAIIKFSEGIRTELSPSHNIHVTCIDPGTVDTPLRENITDEELLEDNKDSWTEDEAKLLAEDIAECALFAISQPERVNLSEMIVKPTGKG